MTDEAHPRTSNDSKDRRIRAEQDGRSDGFAGKPRRARSDRLTAVDHPIDRRAFVAAVGAGSVTGLAGCVGNEDNNDGDTRTIQITAPDEWRNAAADVRGNLYDAGMSEDIHVEMTSPGQTTDDSLAQYQQWLSAGLTQPDLLVCDVGWIRPFIVRDQLLSLDDVLPDETLERIRGQYVSQSVQSATGEDGDLYAVPLYPDLPTIQYRRDLVEDAGYDWQQYATDPLSWERFAAELGDVYEQSDVDYGFNWQAASELQLSCCVFNEFLSSWGGAYFGNPEENLYTIGNRPITVTEEPVLKALRMARTFIHGSDASETLSEFTGGITSTEASQWGLSPSMRPFTQGNAIALRNWPYSININGAEDALGETMGVMPIPYGVSDENGKYPNTGGSIAALGGWNYAVNPETEKLDACVEFLEALTTESFQLSNFELIGHIPPIADVLENATDVPVMGRYVDTLTYASEHSLARPATAIWPEQSQVVAQEANGVIMGDSTPENGMDRLANRLKQIEESV